MKIFIFLYLLLFSNCSINTSPRLLSILNLLGASAQSSQPPPSANTLSSNKDITAFSFPTLTPPVTANIAGNAITAIVSSSTNVSSLVATFTTNGTKVEVNQTQQTSGVTANNFTNPVIYVVTAEDGTTKNYSVTLVSSGYSTIGTTSAANITGLTSSDSPLVLTYNSGTNTFSSFENNTKIGVILPNLTSYSISIQTQPSGKNCSLRPGVLPLVGTLTGDVSFTVNCVSGILSYGNILPVQVTASIGNNLGDVVTVVGSPPPTAVTGNSLGPQGLLSLINFPFGLTSDNDFLYIAESGNSCIRRYDTVADVLSNFAGLCGTSGTTSGIGTAARFNDPIALTNDGTYIYVSDRGNNSIRRIEISTATVSDLASISGVGSGDIVGSSNLARFNFPNSITGDTNFLYVADRGNQKIKRINKWNGFVSLLAGNGSVGNADNSIGTAATLTAPSTVLLFNNELYFGSADPGNRIRKVTLSGTNPVTTLIGTGATSSVDGTGTGATTYDPQGMTSDGTTIYFSEWSGTVLRSFNPSTLSVTTIAFSTTTGYADGTGTVARSSRLGNIVLHRGRMYITDSGNNSIRMLNNPFN